VLKNTAFFLQNNEKAGKTIDKTASFCYSLLFHPVLFTPIGGM